MSMLDTIELSDYLRLKGLKNRPLVAQSLRYLADGGQVHQSVAIAGGVLYLDGYRDGNALYGFFTGAQVDAIRNLQLAGSVVEFTHPLGSWFVTVYECEFEQVSKRSAPGETEKYTGTVTLLLQ